MLEDIELVRDVARFVSRAARALSLAYVVLGVGSSIFLASTEQTQRSLADLTRFGRGLHDWQSRLFLASVVVCGSGLFLLFRYAREITDFCLSPWRVPRDLLLLPWAAGLLVPLLVYAAMGPNGVLFALAGAFLIKVSVGAAAFEHLVSRLEGLVGFRTRVLRWILLAAVMHIVVFIVEGSLIQAGERVSTGGWNVQRSPAEIDEARWRVVQWGTAELFGSGVQMFAVSRILRRLDEVAEALLRRAQSA